MRFLRSTIAVWLLVTFGACYAFPISITMSARTASCCHRGGHGSCCRKNENTASPSWTAAADCAQGCRLSADLTVDAAPLVASGPATAHAAVRSETLVPQNAHPAGVSSYFAFLYQRPPPSRF